jgi:hypothetical protein
MALRRSIGCGGGLIPPTGLMGQVILQAFEAGSSLRAIAAAAGMSHEKVRAIVAIERKRRARRQFEKYEKHEAYDAQTDYLEFAGRPHLMMVAEGWEEIAEAVDSWLDGVLGASDAPAEGASA